MALRSLHLINIPITSYCPLPIHLALYYMMYSYFFSYFCSQLYFIIRWGVRNYGTYFYNVIVKMTNFKLGIKIFVLKSSVITKVARALELCQRSDFCMVLSVSGWKHWLEQECSVFERFVFYNITGNN